MTDPFSVQLIWPRLILIFVVGFGIYSVFLNTDEATENRVLAARLATSMLIAGLIVAAGLTAVSVWDTLSRP